MSASIELGHGRTAYELVQPPGAAPDAPLVVLLHGGTVPMWCWDAIVPALAGAGHRVLRYDLYGRGLSASPPVAHERALFVAQGLELLDALGLDRAPLHWVGFSFGGAIATLLALARPGRVRSLALVAPVLCFEAGNRVVRLARLPIVGPAFVRGVVIRKATARAAWMWKAAPPADRERYRAAFEAQMRRPGFARALLSYLRSDALGDYTAAYREAGRHAQLAAVPQLLAWGTADRDIPAAHTARIRAALPGAHTLELPGVHHGVPFEAPAALRKALLDHLARADARP